MKMDELLTSLYTAEQEGNVIEKTAEAKLMNALANSGQTENPFMDMPLEDLMKIAGEVDSLEQGNTQQVEEYVEDAEWDEFGGKQMAHACVHELGLMKEAMQNGLCRVCKTNAFDIDGSSVCSACMGE